jgi:hypothetical protein
MQFPLKQKVVSASRGAKQQRSKQRVAKFEAAAGHLPAIHAARDLSSWMRKLRGDRMAEY